MRMDSKVKSLGKALRVLECFDVHTQELGVTQISERLGMSKSNVFNILATFQDADYIEKDEKTGKYKLGMKLLEYSYVINENLGYQRNTYDVMLDITRELNAISYFAIPRRGKVFYISSVYPASAHRDFPYRTITGETAPFYCTALGKSMLAFMDARDCEACLAQPRRAFTEYTITDGEALRRELARIRHEGYSLDNQEHEYGVRCLGVPVMRQNGNMVGAISVSGPTTMMDEGNMDNYIRVMKEAAYKLRDRI